MRRAAICLLVTALTGAFGNGHARADDANPNNQQLADKLFGKFGYSVEKSVDSKKCNVNTVLDQKTFTDSFTTIQQLQMLNSSLTEMDLKTKPMKIMSAFLTSMVVVTVKNTYEDNPDADKCTFTNFINAIDDYGNDQRTQTYSFDFDRSTFKRINWDNFEDYKIFKISKHLRFDPVYQRALESEPN